MKFIWHNQSKRFRAIRHVNELTYPRIDKNIREWEILDFDTTLPDLLEKYGMLHPTDDERNFANLTFDNTTERDKRYLLDQARLVHKFGDDPLERIVTRILDVCEDDNIDRTQYVETIQYGLSTKVRRLALAFVERLGVNI